MKNILSGRQTCIHLIKIEQQPFAEEVEVRNGDGNLKKGRFAEVWGDCGWKGLLCEINRINRYGDIKRHKIYIKNEFTEASVFHSWGKLNNTTQSHSGKLDPDFVEFNMSLHFLYQTR